VKSGVSESESESDGERPSDGDSSESAGLAIGVITRALSIDIVL
jgi:hypothetical protein